MVERNGKRRMRAQIIKSRAPKLGHYIIVTDAAATEKSYIQGLHASLPLEIKG